MIYIYMRGRLGNQLFQYAFVRALQEKNPGIKVLYNFDEINSMGKKEDGWENSLKYFNVKEMKEMDNGNKPKLSVAKENYIEDILEKFSTWSIY